MRYGAILTAMAVMLLVACKSTTPLPPSSNQPPPVQYEQGPQARPTPKAPFTPGIAVAPIQHSPWTTTTNDPSVTLQANQPVSITTTSNISLFAPSLIATTNAVNGMLNVKSFGAVGNGAIDDTAAIQSAFNSAGAQNAVVMFPPGKYVTTSLTTPAGMRGIVGFVVPGTKRSIQFASELVLKSGANTNILIVPPGSYLDITQMAFDGNLTNQTVAAPAIIFQPANYTGNIRNECHLYGVAVHHSKGDGLFINREEVFIGNSMFCWNGGNGVTFSNAVDCTYGDDTGAGFNGGHGVALYGNSSSCRFFHFDAFSNHGCGLYIDGMAGIGDDTFIRGQFNNNFQSGLLITNIAANLKFSLCKFLMSNYNDDGWGVTNSTPTGTYSDVQITDGAYLTDLDFIGCDMGLKAGNPSTNKLPEYAFKDTRMTAVAGSGITILGGMIGVPSNFSSGDSLYNHAVFQESATIIGLKTESAVLPYGPGNLGGGPISFFGPITMYGNGTNIIYQSLPGELTFQISPTNGAPTLFWRFQTNGVSTLPGVVNAGGNITNVGFWIMIDPAHSGTNMIYSLGETNGGIGFQTGLNGSSQFWGLHSDGWTALPGTLSTVGSITNGSALWFTGNGVTHVYQSATNNLVLELGPSGSHAYVSFDGNGTVNAPFVKPLNMSASTLAITDGGGVLTSIANQPNSVLLNNGSQPFLFAGKTTNINVLCDGGVTNQFQFVSGVLSNIVAVP